MTADTQLLVSFVKTKVNADGKITDEETVNGVNKLILSLTQIISNEKDELLSAPILMNEGIKN